MSVPFKSVLRRLATQSPCDMKHSSVVIRGGSLVGRGFNHDERHAEVAALTKLWPSEREGTTVINLRIRKDGTLALSKPCQDCCSFMRENGVRKVIYSTIGGWGEMSL